jgi:hypothetical protein
VERAVSAGESERVEIEGRPRVRLDGYERAEMQVRVKDWGLFYSMYSIRLTETMVALGDEHFT